MNAETATSPLVSIPANLVPAHEMALAAAVARDFPLAIKALADVWGAEWAHLPSEREVWAEGLEQFVRVNWRSRDHNWYMRICAFELLRTDAEGEQGCAMAVPVPPSPSSGYRAADSTDQGFDLSGVEFGAVMAQGLWERMALSGVGESGAIGGGH